MGDGSWVFSMVRRDGGYGWFAYVLGLACRATHAGDRRIDRVSLLRKDTSAARSRSGPGIRKRANRCRSWVRPGFGHVFWGHAHGALRMASLLHRAWSRQHGLADSLVPVDAARRDYDFSCGDRWPRVSRTP